MELTIDRKRLFARLRAYLGEMDRCASTLEEIMMMEQEATRRFDGEALLDLCDLRASCREKMAELEGSCRRVLHENGVDDAVPLSEFIASSHDVDDDLRALRRNLYHRMLHLQQEMQDGQLRLKAAADVTTNLLRSIGLIQTPQTYHPGEVK
ncbi:MAG: flagellar export chaperone FlgN [Mariprofundales bacterium]|nr:flagellar export chaperone FlgN [Mariprofundales bacterium]